MLTIYIFSMLITLFKAVSTILNQNKSYISNLSSVLRNGDKNWNSTVLHLEKKTGKTMKQELVVVNKHYGSFSGLPHASIVIHTCMLPKFPRKNTCVYFYITCTPQLNFHRYTVYIFKFLFLGIFPNINASSFHSRRK